MINIYKKEEGGHCPFCGTNGSEYPVYECSESGTETSEHLTLDDEVFGRLCFTCGTDWSIGEQVYWITCGTPYTVGVHDIGMCPNCIEY